MRTRRARIHFFFPWVTHDEFFLFDYDDANIALGGYTATAAHMLLLLFAGMKRKKH
jgi:hypothetical protein